MSIAEQWTVRAQKIALDRKIVGCLYVPDEEFGHVLLLLLDNGTRLYVMADDEGNGPGALHCELANGAHEILPRIKN